MKNLFLATIVLSYISAFASGIIQCDLEATVEKVQAIGVLDNKVVVSRFRNPAVDTYHYVANLEITSSKLVYGNGSCPTGEQLIALKTSTQVNVGDMLKIDYSATSDRSGHATTYKLKH